MSIADLYRDYGIPTAPEGHKHFREGWVNTACPHCTGSAGFHLGFNLDGNYFYCWRCGHHFVTKTLAKILNLGYKQAKEISFDYQLRNRSNRRKSNKVVKLSKYTFKQPSGVIRLDKPHIKYLEKRNFDPEFLSRTYKIRGTSPHSKLDDGDGKLIRYGYRIFIPFFWEDQMVSYQCRDYTNRQKIKYMACPEKREIVHHKNILYSGGIRGDVGICVEGVFDVWRLGSPAFATMGIGYTQEQLKVMKRLFKKIFIVFDPEKQAQQQASKLQGELRARGIETYIYKGLETDPGDLTENDARHLLKELNIKSSEPLHSSSSY